MPTKIYSHTHNQNRSNQNDLYGRSARTFPPAINDVIILLLYNNQHQTHEWSPITHKHTHTIPCHDNKKKTQRAKKRRHRAKGITLYLLHPASFANVINVLQHQQQLLFFLGCSCYIWRCTIVLRFISAGGGSHSATCKTTICEVV